MHRYDRVIGFLPSKEDQAEIDNTDAVKQAWEQRRQEAVKHQSHHRRVELRAIFERWCLARAPDSASTGWLRSLQMAVDLCEEGAEEPRRVTLMAPPTALVVALVVAYIGIVRKDPHSKGEREYAQRLHCK